MFSGIVEFKSRVCATNERPGVLVLHVVRPHAYDDLSVGDSIAVNGICLTVEIFDQNSIGFALGPETLRVTGWTAAGVKDRDLNLERSLRLNDRIHGHMVIGHVDALGKILAQNAHGETLHLKIGFPEELRPYIWPKGSVAVNGVSLTLNAVENSSFEVGLIPETMKRTNLGQLQPGDSVNLEIDNMARGLVHFVKIMKEKAL